MRVGMIVMTMMMMMISLGLEELRVLVLEARLRGRLLGALAMLSIWEEVPLLVLPSGKVATANVEMLAAMTVATIRTRMMIRCNETLSNRCQSLLPSHPSLSYAAMTQ
jgi:hypothetical protein